MQALGKAASRAPSLQPAQGSSVRCSILSKNEAEEKLYLVRGKRGCELLHQFTINSPQL